MKCERCGKSLGFAAVLVSDEFCPSCQELVKREHRERKAADREQEAMLRKRAESVLVTTTHNIDGWKVAEYLGIESVECVIGTGMFSEITTDVRDFLGMRSTAFEKKLQAAKASTFEAIKVLAAQKGGNAIVGVDIDYTEFSGNRIGLIVNGTVVLVVRETPAE
jgi:uncharacterized protein YbjQ (UPF0145 family)